VLHNFGFPRRTARVSKNCFVRDEIGESIRVARFESFQLFSFLGDNLLLHRFRGEWSCVNNE